METTVYFLPNIPEDLVKSLESDYDDLAYMLNLESYLDTPWAEEFLQDLKDYPVPKELPISIINKIKKFYSDVYESECEQKNLKMIEPSDENLLTLLNIRNLLSEQLGYIYNSTEEKDKCGVSFICSRINGIPYGGIFMFWDEEDPSYVVIQGICKFITPSLISLLDQENSKKLPRLNDLLNPVIEQTARTIGAKIIYVAPIGKQGKILEKYFGYNATNYMKYPSKIILVFDKDHQRSFFKELK